jgi:UDP:flavonoid glycosyltransferase YjiC (YdhE family)
VRILVGFAGGIGHFLPTAPIARAAQAAGHTVVVAGRPQHAAEVTALGFEALPIGEDAKVPGERTALRPLNARFEDRVVREGFARRIARERAAALVPLAEAWRPDVIVHDETDFGAMVAAERLGIPHANVLVLAAGSFARRPVVEGPLRELRAAHGLPPDLELAMLDRDLVLSPFPPSFRDPAFPLPSTGYPIRPTAADPHVEPPRWLGELADRPLVYATLGTVFNPESGDLFERVLEGLGSLPVSVVVTVGRGLDRSALGHVPPNVRVEDFVPQAALLPRADLVVCHGGSGSVTGALAHGLPLLVLPMGADQPANAARCEALGVGRSLTAVDAAPADVRTAAAALLGGSSFREAAERIAAEVAALPGPEHAVALLEHLRTT